MSDTTVTEPEKTEPSKALERITSDLRGALADISLDDLLKKLQPALAPRAEVELLDIPAISPLSDEQKAALTKLPLVYGKVCPDTVRKLEATEVKDLLEERYVLDDVEDICKKRKEAIRSAVCNHIDMEHADDDLPRDDKGHVLIKEKVKVAGQPKCFSLELRSYEPPFVTAEALKELADDPEVENFSQADYLAMTTQTRVVDEHKVMLALQKNPVLLQAIAKATRPGKTGASLFVRKA